MKVKPTKRELQAIKRLQKCIDSMPKTLWLFSNGQMSVMKYGEDGKPVYNNRAAVDPNYRIGGIDGINSEGGDW